MHVLQLLHLHAVILQSIASSQETRAFAPWTQSSCRREKGIMNNMSKASGMISIRVGSQHAFQLHIRMLCCKDLPISCRRVDLSRLPCSQSSLDGEGTLLWMPSTLLNSATHVCPSASQSCWKVPLIETTLIKVEHASILQGLAMVLVLLSLLPPIRSGGASKTLAQRVTKY